MEYFASQVTRSYSFCLNIWFRAQKSYRDFQETGPWASLLRAADAFRVTWSESGPVVRLGYVTENALTEKTWEVKNDEVLELWESTK